MKFKLAVVLAVAILIPSARGFDQPPKTSIPTIKLKSAKVASRYSLLSTIAPLAIALAADGRAGTDVLAYAGLIFGPSAGYFYAADYSRAFKGIGIRLGGTGLMIGGFAVALDDNLLKSHRQNDNLAGSMIIAGGGIMLADLLVDIANAGNAAKNHNQKLQSKTFSIMPIYHQKLKLAGLQLDMKF